MEGRVELAAGDPAGDLRALRRRLETLGVGAGGSGAWYAWAAVALAALLIAGVVAYAFFRRRLRYSKLVAPREHVPTSSRADSAAESSKQRSEAKGSFNVRSWLDSQKKAPTQSQNWISDCEEFVTQFEALEDKCAKYQKESEGLEEQNQTLHQRIATLEAALRKLPQTPMSIPSLGSTEASTRDADTPPTSDATDIRTPKSEEGTTARESECDQPVRIGEIGESEERSPRDARQPEEPSRSDPPFASLPPLPLPERPPLLPLRPTSQQELNEAKTTFTPLFEEKTLSTPRTLMELMGSHRLTKESLGARIKKRNSQAAMLTEQRAAMEAQLPLEQARADAAQSALDKLAAATSPRSREEALAALVSVHGARLDALASDVEGRRNDAEAYFAYAYRIQNRLNKEMDMNRIETVKSPAGVLLPAMGPPPPIALGAVHLPAQKDLSSLVVNPYKVDSWPIEPNSRGAKASGELCMPPIRDAPEEEEDVPESDCESEDDGFPRALPGLRYGQSPHVVRYDEDEDEDEDDGDDDESKASGEDEEDIPAGTAADSAADTPATPVRYGAAPPLGAPPPPSAGGGAASPGATDPRGPPGPGPAGQESSPGGADPPPAAPAPVEARSPSPDVGMAKAPPKRLPPLDLGKM